MAIKPSQYKILQPFEAWVQQTLPAIYDDSLSYTDLLSKMLYYINGLVGNNSNLISDMKSTIEYINNYFSSTDFIANINNKLDEMAEDGTLSNLIQPLFDVYKEQIDNDFDEYKGQIDNDFENLKKQTNKTVTTQNNSISNIQSQQNLLKERMDTFTQLPSGSTTGDAELKDIRIGYNGSIYNTAGDSVRGQAKELSSTLPHKKYLYDKDLQITGVETTRFINPELDMSHFKEATVIILKISDLVNFYNPSSLIDVYIQYEGSSVITLHNTGLDDYYIIPTKDLTIFTFLIRRSDRELTSDITSNCNIKISIMENLNNYGYVNASDCGILPNSNINSSTINALVKKYGNLKFNKGTYNIINDTMIILPSNSTLEGENEKTTILNYTNTNDIIFIQTKDKAHNVTIRNLTLECNKHSSAGILINVSDNDNLEKYDVSNIIENVTINNVNGEGIAIDSQARNCLINNCTVFGCSSGINSRGTDNFINNCLISYCDGYAMSLNSNNTISNCKAFLCGVTSNDSCIKVYGYGNILSNISVQQNYGNGIHIYGNGCYVDGCADSNGYNAVNSYHNIVCDGYCNIINVTTIDGRLNGVIKESSVLLSNNSKANVITATLITTTNNKPKCVNDLGTNNTIIEKTINEI